MRAAVTFLIVAAIASFSLALMPSCGGKYELEVTPVNVNVRHSFDLTEILLAFKSQCRRELGPTATADEVDDCAQAKVAQFIQDISEAIDGG